MMRRLAIVGVLLLGAYLRWMDLGAEPFLRDQAVISLKAADVARGLSLELQGPEMSYGGVSHSPWSIYLYALPYLIAPDPRVANTFTGAMNVVAISLLYALARRYSGSACGLVAAVLYATQPIATLAGRFIWNINIAGPFVMLYLWTGFLGHHEGRKWARLWHLPALSLAGQCHPVAFLLAPLSLLFGVHAWRTEAGRRARLVRHTLASGGLALVLLLPWAAGYCQSRQAGLAGSEAPGWRQLLDPIQALSGRAVRPGERSSSIDGYVSLTLDSLGGNWRGGLPWSLPHWLTAAGAAWLIAAALYRKRALPELAILLGLVLPPLGAFLLSTPLVKQYLWPTVGLACWMQGAILGRAIAPAAESGQWCGGPGLRRVAGQPGAGWLGGCVAGVIVFVQLRADFTVDRSEGLIPLRESVAALDAAREVARRAGKELLIVVANPRAGQCLECSGWELLPAIQGYDARVIWDSNGMPLPAKGAILFGLAGYHGRPFVFAGGETVRRWFRLAELTPVDRFAPDLRPVRPIRFSNGAAVLGFLRETPGSLPVLGRTWTLFMIWQGDGPESLGQKFFVHLVDEAGNLYAQADRAGLPQNQWREGETVMTQLDLPLGSGFPQAGPLYLRFGFYDDDGQAEALDEASQAIGSFALMQVRGDAPPVAQWSNGVEISRLSTNSPVPQGPPLEVSVTWHGAHTPAHDLRLRWRLIASDGHIAFEAGDEVRAAPMTEWPAGLFLSEQYALRLPTDIAAGAYRLELQATDAGGDAVERPVTLDVEVAARERAFKAPAMGHVAGATFAGQIELLGYDLRQAEGTVELLLHWQAMRAMANDYKYFVHLWSGGKFVTGVDGMPEAWRYPTSWWAPGEVVSEAIRIDLATLPPGSYTLTTGFYDPATGERLSVALPGGATAADPWVELRTVSVP